MALVVADSAEVQVRIALEPTATTVPPTRGQRLRLAYETEAGRLENLGRLRLWLAREGFGSGDALRAVSGLHRAALRRAATAVFGPTALDPGTGRPRPEVLGPDVEAHLLAVLAERLGLPADEVVRAVQEHSADQPHRRCRVAGAGHRPAPAKPRSPAS